MASQHIAVSLSGGGHRASLFGLGALTYLVDAGKGPEISTISSISGGSLTNGWVGLNADLTTVGADEFDELTRTLATRIARKGTLWAYWMTYALVAAMLLVVAGAIVATVIWGSAVAWLVWLVAIVLLGVLTQRRSWVARKSFEHGLFHGKPLSDLHTSLHHVICATDLQTAEHVYFSSKYVYSYRTGMGVADGLHVADAAQASAALPGAFTPVSIPLAPHRFPKSPSFTSFLLTDGGVYDNMGTEWIFRVVRGFDDDAGATEVPTADEAIVVNSSAAKDVVNRGKARIPLLGEVMTLLAVKDVMYDQTTAVRRRWLNLRYRIADRAPDALPNDLLRGATIQIDRSPYELADSYAKYGDELAQRAQAAIARLDAAGGRDFWQREAGENENVGTTLSKIPVERAAGLLRHAYVLTMVNAHVLLGYPLLDIPSVERARRWVT
ncbi:MAG: patatin-like phospholipase family protein [Ilumatobacter sp.]|uniref:patatin-like phospholipase family protein n=1 Tax=Ilumatobacter sp. TaxID=1967498 RepID=UPI00260A3A22|nr:patatin-like phospholipase family protein [Ilumatobacter sp.]MDJ0770576.1 patatin-like phospholipase family protein [Ilumatobacter sp.]